MDLIYTQDFTVSDIAVDRYGRLKLSTLLYYAQEVAGQHCLYLGADYDTLAKRNLFWAVTRHKAVIHRLPSRGETVTVETWPMPTTRVAYPRSMAAYDAQGQLLFQSVSIWVLMDMESRKMVLPGRSGISVEGILRGNELDSPHSLMPKERENSQLRPVTFSCLDRNGHMNNTRYLDWVDDLLQSDFHAGHTPREFVICYLNEAREGQQIRLNWSLSQELCLQVDAHREQQETEGKHTAIFSAHVYY